MKRLEQTSDEFLGRYRVVDDTISTWAVRDTETGEIVEKGLTKLRAELKAEELNGD